MSSPDEDQQKKIAQGDFLVTSSSGNHGLACIDAMKKWVPLFPSSNAYLSSFEYAYFRYGLKGRIIVPRMVSDAKPKNLFYLLETQNQRWAPPSGRSSSWPAPTCSSTATIVWRPRCTAGAPQYTIGLAFKKTNRLVDSFLLYIIFSWIAPLHYRLRCSLGRFFKPKNVQK